MGHIAKKLMTDIFEIKGEWYLKGMDLDGNGVNGILHYSPEKITLELIGSFYETFNVNLDHRPTIFGFSEKGEWVTLLKCVPNQIRLNASGFNTCAYSTDRFYAGTQIIDDEKSAMLTGAAFSFTNLNAWMDFSMMEYCFLQESGKIGCTANPEMVLAEAKTIEIPSVGLVLTEDAERSLMYPSDFFLQEKTEITVNKFYRFLPLGEKTVTPEKMLTNMHQLRRLMSFISGSAMYFTYVEFSLSNSSTGSIDGGAHKEKERCRVFFRQVGDIGQAEHLSPHTPGSILLKRSDIKEDLGQAINNWFLEGDKIGECINAYISDLYLPAYMENRFLNIVRGIETYHRFFVERASDNSTSTLRETEELSEDYHKIIHYIMTEISEENQEYFLTRIRFTDEKSLRSRLNELLRMTHPKLVEQLFGDMPSAKRKKMVSKIIDTRNYYTHRDKRENYQNIADSLTELRLLTERLSILLQYFCLTYIGIDRDIVAQRLVDAAKRQGL